MVLKFKEMLYEFAMPVEDIVVFQATVDEGNDCVRLQFTNKHGVSFIHSITECNYVGALDTFEKLGLTSWRSILYYAWGSLRSLNEHEEQLEDAELIIQSNP